MKKKVVGIISVLLLNLLCVQTVLAASSLNADLNADKQSLKAGEQIELTLAFNNFNDIKKGINAYMGTLEYDTNIFENVVEKNFLCLNNWEQFKFNPSNGKLVAIRKVGTKIDENVLKVTLKVKENIGATKTEVKIKNIVTSEGKKDIFINTASSTINIIEEQTTIPTKPVSPSKPFKPNYNTSGNKPNSSGGNKVESNNPSNPTDENEDDETNSEDDDDEDDRLNEEESKEQSSNKNESTNKNDDLEENPIKTTSSKYIWVLIIILIQIILIIYVYFRHKDKNSNKHLSVMFLTIILAEFIGTTCAFGISFAAKGDLNGDSIVDYADASLLELHLVDLKKLEKDSYEKADMNLDGQLTVTDLTLLIQKLENNLDYEVTIINFEPSNKHPNKNQDLDIKFGSDVSFGALIKKIIIDGKEYDVTKEANTSDYTVKVNSGSEAGLKSYHVTEVILDNNKTIKVDYSFILDVLKDSPHITNYRVEENKDESKLILLFDIVDDEDSLTLATLDVYNIDQEIVTQTSLAKGQNRIEVSVEETKEYKAYIKLEYNLSEDENNTESMGIESYEKDLQLIIDYNFNISNIKAYKENKEQTIFAMGDQVKIGFESTNSTIHIPAFVKVNGKEYEVTEENGKYFATLDPLNTLGDNQILVEEVKLANGKQFELTESNIINIICQKRKPLIEDLSITEFTETNDLKVMFNLNDEDRAVSDMTIILLDVDGSEIDQVKLSRDEVKDDGTVNKFLKTKMTTKYKVKVIMSYNVTQNEDEKVVDELAALEEFIADPRVIIKNVTPNKDYVEKGGVLKLTYELETNKTEDVTRILVNNINCIAVKLDNGNYEVTLNVGANSGLHALTTTRLTYSDSSVATTDKTVNVEILKSKPTVKNFTQTDNVQTREVTLNFDIEDQDNSFLNGKAVLTLDGTSVEREITKGHNSVTFQVEPSRKYTLEIKASYDLDEHALTNKPEEDNRVTDETIDTKEIELIADYELNISNIKTYNEKGETKYFSKSEPIKISFESTNITTFKPVSVVINGNTYQLTNTDNTYYLTIDSHRTSGVKTAKIEKITLNNSKEIIITENNDIKVTVLKDKPVVEQFSYKENMDGTISANFKVIDEEDTITGGKVLIIKNGEIIKEQNIAKNDNTINFQPEENQNYLVKVLADYDLDMNVLEEDANEYTNITLLEADITLGARRFEMKDIIRTSIYKNTENGVVEVNTLSEADLANPSDYIAKVYMREMPTFYTTVTGHKVEDGKLKLTLAYDNVVQYSHDSKQNKLEIEFGELNNGVAQNITLEGLIKEIEANPSGSFTLTRDYDASIITTNEATLIAATFTGTLNGNGHKIYNLTKPMFDTIESATIENITFDTPKVFGTTSRGTIANNAINSTIRNIHLKDLTLISGTSRVGGLIGEGSSTTVEQIEVSNFTITTAGHIRIASIVGNMTGGNIKNCVINGELKSTQNKDGNGISGILGATEGTEIVTIENCITKVNYSSNVSPRLNGDIVGLALNSNTSLKNNVSLSTGLNFYHVHGYSIHSTSSNNFEIIESELTSNASDKVTQISKNDINVDFFKNTAHFDETIWDLSDSSYDNVPELISLKESEEEETTDKPENNKLYIPDYARIQKVNGFTKSKDIIYHNLNKLMPYYDAKYLVEDGLKIPNTSELNDKIIKHILPYANDSMVTYLTRENYNSISKIKVIYDDRTAKEYNVTFKEFKQNIAIYDIEGLDIEYAYSNYTIKEDASIVGTIKEYIDNLDYTATLDSLTKAADSRLYKDNFNEKVKAKSNEIALKLLQNDTDSILTIDNSILNNRIKQQLIDSGRLNKIIYAYNYYDKWYDFEIGGSKVTDILMFEGKIYKNSMTIDNMTNEVLTGSMATNTTSAFYANNIKKYTDAANLGLFLDEIIKNIGGYEDINDWFTEHFTKIGLLSEIPVENHPEVKYRAWDRLKAYQNFILPLSTLPKDAGYIISGPAQLQVGAQRVYTKDPSTAQATLKNTIKNHSALVKRQFDTLADSFHVESWNNFTIMIYDTCKTITGYKTTYFPGTNIPIGTSPVTKINKVGTDEPFHKYFNEAVGAWQYGSAAGVGNTAGFLWFIATQGLTNFDTWTHEYEHALYDKIMLYKRGARLSLECYTEGNVQQKDDWSINNFQGYDVGPYYFNLAFTLDKEGMATQNLTPERINTREKLENYFKGQFDALELLDYVSAKAFIKLTPEQQAKIATRMSQSGAWSTWGTITAAQAESMNLTSLEALWNNRIMLRPNNAWGVSVRGLTPINSIGSNDYGYESIWVTRWYMGHNDNGQADAFSNKKNMFEMLGYAGVDGYVLFGSKQSSTDLDAIQKITKAKTGTAMNWKEYRMSRYAEIESKINNKYVNVDLMIDQFTTALTNDANSGNRNITSATNLRKIYYHYLKSATNDFIDDPLGTTIEVKHIKTPEELIEKINAEPYGYYILDNDLDFSGITTNVTTTFMGKLDGNGHKIIGNTKPIFQKIRYGYVKDLHFEGTNIPMNIANVGALSVRTEYSVIEKVTASKLQLNFGGRNDISLISGAVSMVLSSDIEVDTLKNKISSIEDLQQLNDNPGGIFELEADLDFTGYTGTNSVVTVPFTGKINGKGHTLSNLNNLALFSTLNGTVENLNISNFKNISTGDDITAFAKLTNGATIRNIKFDNITLEGRHRVAVVASFDNTNSTFENISVKNSNVKGSGVYVSNFIGRKYGGIIRNVFVEGNMEITTTENGGIVGALQKGGTVENVVSKVNIHKTGNTYTNIAASEYNGGLIGNIYDKPVIKNSIALGKMEGFINSDGVEKLPYKVTGAAVASIISTMENCYEYVNAEGFSSVTEETAGKLNIASRDEIHSRSFYKDTLHFDENIWNFDSVENVGYPTLK